MRAHQDVNVAGLQIGQDGFAGSAFDRPCEEFHAHLHGAEHLPQPLEVLLGEDFRPPEGASKALPCEEVLATRSLDFRGGDEDEDDLFE